MYLAVDLMCSREEVGSGSWCSTVRTWRPSRCFIQLLIVKQTGSPRVCVLTDGDFPLTEILPGSFQGLFSAVLKPARSVCRGLFPWEGLRARGRWWRCLLRSALCGLVVAGLKRGVNVAISFLCV